MENKSQGTATPEEVAGRELRRLRRQQGWTQEEVAKRMAAYGYDSWHQTTVGKTETGQRPLRLNEVTALAAIFRVRVTDLLLPLDVNLEDVNNDIAQLEGRLAKEQEELTRARKRLDGASDARSRAEYLYEATARALENTEARLDTARAVRDILAQRHEAAEPA